MMRAKRLTEEQCNAMDAEHEANWQAMNTERGIDEILSELTPEAAKTEFRRLTNELHDE